MAKEPKTSVLLDNRLKARKKVLKLGITTGLLIVLLIFVVSLAGTYRSGKANDNPFIQKAISSLNAVGISSTPKPHQVTERTKPSSDQDEFITAFGWPDSFVLNLEPDGKRIEIWQYFVCHSNDVLLKKHFRPCRISFINGKFKNIQYADNTTPPIPKSYRPTEYISSLTRDQIQQEYGKPTLTRNPEIENWGKLEILMYQKEIIFIFRNDSLWGVVTVPEEVKS